MELHGVTGQPYSTPRVQRSIPAPFERPSIDAGGTKKRVWQQTKVADLVHDDVVAEFGRISAIQQYVIQDPREYRVKITNVLGAHRDYGIYDSVFAFHPDE